MESKEFNEKIGKIVGIKTSKIDNAVVHMKTPEHDVLSVVIFLRPTVYQEHRIKEACFEYTKLQPNP